MERVTENQPHGGSVAQDRGAEAHTGARRVNDVRRATKREPYQNDSDDGTAGAREKRGLVASPRERRAGDQQGQRVSRRRARDQPTHRAPTPRRRIAIGDEHDRSRVGAPCVSATRV
jgi:hypothetical protein